MSVCIKWFWLVPAAVSCFLALVAPLLVVRASFCHPAISVIGGRDLQLPNPDKIPLHNMACHPGDSWLYELGLNFALTFLAALLVAVAYFLFLQINEAPGMSGRPASIFMWTTEPGKTMHCKKPLTIPNIPWGSETMFPLNFISGDVFSIHGFLNDTLDVITRNFWLVVWPVGNIYDILFACDLELRASGPIGRWFNFAGLLVV